MTLDADVVRLVREEARGQGVGAVGGNGEAEAYRVRPHRTAVGPVADVGSVNELFGELEDDAVMDKRRIPE